MNWKLLAKLLLLASLIVLVVPQTVWRDLAHWPAQLAYEQQRRDDEQWRRRPPGELPIRPQDYRRFPRSGFGFVITYGTGTRIDTFRGTATKDIGDPDTTIDLRLTPAEMDSVYQAMIAMRFFDLPEPYPPFSSQSGMEP